MHISEELRRINNFVRQEEPRPSEKFVSLLDPFKEKPGLKSKEELSRFELLVFRKKSLTPFKASGTHKMLFNTKNVSWVNDDKDSLNELLRQFSKNKSDFKMAVIYDNILPSDVREDRWIFKYDEGKVSLNRLYEYDAIIKEKYLKEIDRLPVA